jgi:CubicO group peptidase (beta-lactamase class C family)
MFEPQARASRRELLRRSLVAAAMAHCGLASAPKSLAVSTIDDVGRSELPDRLQQILTRDELPALWALFSNAEQTQILEASGVRAATASDPATPEDQIHIGSCTKAMTATLVGLQVDQKKLQWDQPLAALLPTEVLPSGSPLAERTLWQLLTHTAGVPANAPWHDLNQADLPTGRREVVRWTATQALTAPGKFAYSNTGFVIVGAVLEELLGQPWERTIREQLWTPLGMERAGFGPPAPPQPSGHSWTASQAVPRRSDNAPVLGPAGTVHLPLDQWARFARIFIQYKNAETLLTESSWRRLQTPAPGTEAAAGWMAVERPKLGGRVLTHAGSNTMWFAVVWVFPARQELAMAATNVGGDKAPAACDEVIRLLLTS